MDAFYASVEQRDDAKLRGRPVIVGANPNGGRGRGVVAACSYEARKFGVRSALPIGLAWRLCPQGAFVPVRMARYVEVSRQVMDVLRQFTNLVEPLSIDEAFLDVTGSTAIFGSAESIAGSIKTRIRETTALCASVGAAPSKFVAKIASDLRKPDGLVIVEADQVEDFLHDLPISRLWGVGPKTEERLHALGIHAIGDLRRRSKAETVQLLGNHGEHLHDLAWGRDERPVVPDWDARSISNETTFDDDTRDRGVLLQKLRTLAESVGRRLRQSDFRAGRITLKIRYEGFETHTRQISLDRPTHSDDDIVEAATALFEQFSLDRKVRLIGVGSGDFTRSDSALLQRELFSDSGKRDTLDRTVDAIRTKFGNTALRRASQLKHS
jgi:nucleotidyltransferase/DNA polymerase involved in DNA repair